jgi:hypothetical protein
MVVDDNNAVQYVLVPSPADKIRSCDPQGPSLGVLQICIGLSNVHRDQTQTVNSMETRLLSVVTNIIYSEYVLEMRNSSNGLFKIAPSFLLYCVCTRKQ